MLISMTPNEEVKTIHASLNDGSLRKWEFEPYTENGKIELTDQDYATIQSIKGNTVKFNQIVSSSTSTLTLTNGHKYYTVIGGTKAITNGTGQSISVTGGTDMAIDLTLIFDSGNEPSTVSDFETWLSNNIGLLPYYDYTPGTLIPFMGTGLKTTGKNLLNITRQSSVTLGVTITIEQSEGTVKLEGTAMASGTIVLNASVKLLKGTYRISDGGVGSQSHGFLYIPTLNVFVYNNETTFTLNEEKEVEISIRLLSGQTYNDVFKPMVVFSDADQTFEPYTESTLSLPISTYFPTGMKEAGSVYDEITESKATTRLNEVVFNGSEAWAQGYPSQRFYLEGAITDFKDGAVGIATNGWEVVTNNTDIMTGNNKIWFQVTGSTYRINAYANTLGLSDAQAFKTYLTSNPITLTYELATPTSQDISLDLTYPVWDDGTEQILPINGSTPTTSPMVATIEYPDRTEDVNFLYKQTTFESAIPQFSLVCKNQELPMTLEDGKLICECDSSITNESGFFDCKVKMQDLESVAYSQKIQLHVERGIND